MTETLRRGYPGMKSVKDMPMVQDGPPPGGFPSVRYGRRIPTTGPTGAALFGIGAAVMAYGFYKVGQTNHESRTWKAEKLYCRQALIPVLQAEEDRRWLEANKQTTDFEAGVMKNVPGWVPGQSVYNTKRWMPPARPVGVWGSYDGYPTTG